ncbi:MAG: hypothetical protein AB1393_02510 [Candidatus Edwardsbacteria bacterium]
MRSTNNYHKNTKFGKREVLKNFRDGVYPDISGVLSWFILILAVLCLISSCSFFKKKEEKPEPERKPVVADTILLRSMLAESLRVKRLPSPSLPDTTKQKKVAKFTIEISGPVELHLYDAVGNHTGPATPEEYLPMVEALLSQKDLHEQEQEHLLNIKEEIIQTGSAARFATFKNIPGSSYNVSGEKKTATLLGQRTFQINLLAQDEGYFTLWIKIQYDDSTFQKIGYENVASTAKTKGEMEISLEMSDWTLMLDKDGDGDFETEVEPSSRSATYNSDSRL